jgi:hypothetical protein
MVVTRHLGLAFSLHKTRKAPAADSPVTPSRTSGGDTFISHPADPYAVWRACQCRTKGSRVDIINVAKLTFLMRSTARYRRRLRNRARSIDWRESASKCGSGNNGYHTWKIGPKQGARVQDRAGDAV